MIEPPPPTYPMLSRPIGSSVIADTGRGQVDTHSRTVARHVSLRRSKGAPSVQSQTGRQRLVLIGSAKGLRHVRIKVSHETPDVDREALGQSAPAEADSVVAVAQKDLRPAANSSAPDLPSLPRWPSRPGARRQSHHGFRLAGVEIARHRISADHPATRSARHARGSYSRKTLRPRPAREALIYCASRPGEGSPGIFSGDKPLKMERFESRASPSAS